MYDTLMLSNDLWDQFRGRETERERKDDINKEKREGGKVWRVLMDEV